MPDCPIYIRSQLIVADLYPFGVDKKGRMFGSICTDIKKLSGVFQFPPTRATRPDIKEET